MNMIASSSKPNVRYQPDSRNIETREYAEYYVKSNDEMFYWLQNSKSDLKAKVFLEGPEIRILNFERYINPGKSVGAWVANSHVTHSVTHRTAIIMNSLIDSCTILENVILDYDIMEGEIVRNRESFPYQILRSQELAYNSGLYETHL